MAWGRLRICLKVGCGAAANVIDITLEDNAVWQVTGTSLIHSLTISGDSSVIIPEGVTLTVNGIDYSGCTMTAGSYCKQEQRRIRNLINQDITGAILTDSSSSVSVNLDAGSTWTLTGDSYVSSFNGDLSNINLNGYTLYVNGVAVTK